jgi:hypothetical protein
LNNLPYNLKILLCNDNDIKNLDNIPNSISDLRCTNNKINKFNNLPINIKTLACVGNPFEYKFAPTIRNIIKDITFLKNS